MQLWKKKDASSVGTRPLNHLQTNLDIMQFMSQILLLTVTIRMVDTNWERATGWIWMCWNHWAAYKTRCDVDWMMAPSGVAWDGRERESFNNVVAATEFKVTVCMCCRLSHWQRGPHVCSSCCHFTANAKVCSAWGHTDYSSCCARENIAGLLDERPSER